MTATALLQSASQIKNITADTEYWRSLHISHYLFRAAFDTSMGSSFGTGHRNWPAGSYPTEALVEAQRRVCTSQGWSNMFDPRSRVLTDAECREILGKA